MFVYNFAQKNVLRQEKNDTVKSIIYSKNKTSY